MEKEARVINTAKLKPGSEHGTYFLPRAYEIPSIKLLTHEVFGPALHVVRWKSDELDDVIDAINGTGFRLTLGVHSRIDATIEHIPKRAKVGNTYVTATRLVRWWACSRLAGRTYPGRGRRRVGRIICCGLLRRGR
jgi:RHH-type proline utilization regulon transcriptional repressor/proline dehydrogenase/delta 1-pyrroline-5-carboxylate dehydrogenase